MGGSQPRNEQLAPPEDIDRSRTRDEQIVPLEPFLSVVVQGVRSQLAMLRAVVLPDEATLLVQQVRNAKLPAVLVKQSDVDQRPRQSCLHAPDPTQPGFRTGS